MCALFRTNLLVFHLLNMTSDQITALRTAFSAPLPGLEAQLAMAHELRVQELERYIVASDHKIAGVVMLIFAEGGELKTTLITRTLNPRDVHSGQVSFPGGRIEADDLSYQQGALRELHEEVGVAPHEVEVLGALTPLYIPVSKFMVHPFVAYAPKRPVFSPQAGEVIHILTPTLTYFLDDANIRRKTMTVGSGYVLNDVPYFDVDGNTLWGATAMILGEFKALTKEMLLRT
jgi:8-oxo-dGTP pyrophosphatase MutT (NUDIX family)